MGLGTLREELGVMDTLGSRDDFLSTDEDIEGVGELLPMSHARNGNGVLGVGHGVEGTDGPAGTCPGCRSRCCTSP